MRWGLALALSAAALLLAALTPAADAAAGTTYCVLTAPSVCPAGGIAEASVTGALTQVNSHAPGVHDMILIGPGSFEEGAMTDSAGHQVDIVGAGQGVTTLKESAATSSTTLSVDDQASTVSNLSIDSPPGSSNTGLELAGQATNVTVTASADDQLGTGVRMISTSGVAAPLFTHGSVAVPFTATNLTTGVADRTTNVLGAVTDSTISALVGTDGVTAVQHTRIAAAVGAQTFIAGSITLDDDLITTVAVPGQQEIGVKIQQPTFSGGTTTAVIRHCTIVGDRSTGSLGISAQAQAATAMASVSAAVDSSIIRDYTTSLDALADGGITAGATASAAIDIDYSDYQTTHAVAHNDASTATATITPWNQVTTADPTFAATSGPRPYQLAAGSAMIDAGDPALGAEEPASDLLGNPRQVAGHAGDSAISDIGAFEFQPAAPTVSAIAPSTGIVGTPAMFTASGNDSAPGDSVTLTWTFDDGATAAGAIVSHTFATAGRHTATATATDLDGFTTQATVAVPITSPPPPVGVITNLRITPRRLIAARHGLSATNARGRKKPGAIVSYIDSEPGLTAFAVLRPTPGTRAGHSCHGLLRQHSNRCTRWVTVGTFTHRDGAGADRFRFTGRIAGRTLRHGHYRLQATTHDPSGTGDPVSLDFTIVGRQGKRH
jgi:hypothetical protein